MTDPATVAAPGAYADIALIELPGSVNFQLLELAPACLPDPRDVGFLDGSDFGLTGIGFGRTEFGGNISTVLKKVRLD